MEIQAHPRELERAQANSDRAEPCRCDPVGRWRVMFLGQGPLAEFAFARAAGSPAIGRKSSRTGCRLEPLRRAHVVGYGAGTGTRHREHSTRFISNAQRNERLLATSAAECAVNLVISIGHPWILSESLLSAMDIEAGP